MPAGPVQAHTTVLCGHVTIKITDAEGNLKSIFANHNIIASKGRRAMADACFAGSAGRRALYVYPVSGFPAIAQSQSMTLGLSGGQPSINNAFVYAKLPKTLAYGFVADSRWSLNGSVTLTNGPTFNGAALCFGPATMPVASISLTDWFAAATFTAYAPASSNVITFVWVFSLSTTTSTAM